MNNLIKLETELNQDVTFYICSVHCTNLVQTYPDAIKEVFNVLSGGTANPEITRVVENICFTYGIDVFQNYMDTIYGARKAS